jgi:hypothetical protein
MKNSEYILKTIEMLRKIIYLYMYNKKYEVVLNIIRITYTKYYKSMVGNINMANYI